MLEAFKNLSSARRQLAVVFGLALFVRTLYALFLIPTNNPYFIEDSPIYWNAAYDWIESGGFNYRHIVDGKTLFLPTTERTPGYPIFLIGLRGIFGESIGSIIAVQLILDSFTCVLIAISAGLICKHLAFFSGLLAALWPNLIIHSALILTDSLFLFFVTLTLLFLILYLKRKNTRFVVAASLMIGIATTIRPLAQFAPYCLIVIVFAEALRGSIPLRSAILATLTIIVVFGIVIGPLVFRNQTIFGSTKLSAQTGVHLMNWVLPEIAASAKGTSHKTGADYYNKLFLERLKRDDISPSRNAFVTSKMFERYAFEELVKFRFIDIANAWLKGITISWAAPAILIAPSYRQAKTVSFVEGKGLLYDRIKRYIFKGNLIQQFSVVFMICSIVFSTLQFTGMWRLFRVDPWLSSVLLLIIIYFMLVTGPIMSPKYRLPTEPLLIIFCAAAMPRRWLTWNQEPQNNCT